MGNRNIGALIGVAFIGLLGLLMFTGSFYTIDQTERGVLLRNGAARSLSEPGLHFKIPFIDSVEKITVRDLVLSWAGDNAMLVYSFDQQPAALLVGVKLDQSHCALLAVSIHRQHAARSRYACIE